MNGDDETMMAFIYVFNFRQLKWESGAVTRLARGFQRCLSRLALLPRHVCANGTQNLGSERSNDDSVSDTVKFSQVWRRLNFPSSGKARCSRIFFF